MLLTIEKLNLNNETDIDKFRIRELKKDFFYG